MRLHSRTRSSDSNSISAALTGQTVPAVKRRSFLSDRRPSPLAGFRRYSYTNASAMTPIAPGNEAVDSIKHKAPFIGVVSTFGDLSRDSFLNSLFNPNLRPPQPEQARPYTSVSINNHQWRCWVDQVVHPLSQPDHFAGQLAQLDVLVIMYSSDSATSFSSVGRICETYLAHEKNKLSTEPGHVKTGANLPFPIVVAFGGPSMRPVIGDRPVPTADGQALARKYNGRFVSISNFTTAKAVQAPIEVAVAAWVKSHTGVDILPEDRAESPLSDSQPLSTNLSAGNTTAQRPSYDKRHKSSIVDDRRSKGSRASLKSADGLGGPSGTNANGSLMSPGGSAFSAIDESPEKKSGRMGRVFQAIKRRVNSSPKRSE